MKNPVPFTHLLTLLQRFPSPSGDGYRLRPSEGHIQSEGRIPTVPDSPLPPSVSDWAESSLRFRPDPLQAQILDSPSHRLILLCARQFGKSTLAAIKALHFALARPNSTVLCVSPTLRRSTEWLRIVHHFFSILASPQTEPRGSSPKGCDQAVFLPQRGSSPKGCDQAVIPNGAARECRRHDQAVKTSPPPPTETSPSRRRRDKRSRAGARAARDQAVNTHPNRAGAPPTCSEPRGSSPKGCDQAVSPHPPANAEPATNQSSSPRPSTIAAAFPWPCRLTHNHPIPVPVPRPRATSNVLTLPNRSRILALPGTAHSNRGYSAHLLLFEEAAFIPDPVFTALLPTVAATGGAVWLISSAGPPSGFFHEIWTQPDMPYTRFKADATQCPRITQEHLDEARLALGELRFRREYLCEFSPDALPIFSPDLLDAALDDSFDPWLQEAA